MPVPKTNLFQGDRVKLSKSYIIACEIRFGRDSVGKGGNAKRGLWRETLERHGTIVNDLLAPKSNYIRVHWDGNKACNAKDVYMPDELELVEEEDEQHVA